ncbi:NAD(P)H-dependent oxidoreductase [Limibacter armeniacum]|uniref:NAD(P)H-dependent oxidoreductase n=1 Tax=Limibacter armeniacum TaxID=466084 RepID=UPI002FE59F70
MNVIEKLNWRYATKKFSTEKLPQDKVDTILEAATLTASSYGLQPWSIVVVNDPAVREQLVEHSWGQMQVKDASHLLVIARQSDMTPAHVEAYIDNIVNTRNIPADAVAGFKDTMLGTVNSLSAEDKALWMSKQAYIVLGNLLTVCATLDVDACPMEGFIPEKYDEILGLKEKGLASVLVLPIGIRAEDDSFQHMKKVRKSLEDTIVTI